MNISGVLDDQVRRDIEVFSGNPETVTLTTYNTDDIEQSAVDMSAETMQLLLYYSEGYTSYDYGDAAPVRTAFLTKDGTAGVATTFSLTKGDTNSLRGRYSYMIKKGVGDLSSAMVYGAFTVK